ncbi:YggS family pyridoxal phosphate-dependent enzyme [Fluviicola sp.]|uniref:YggS family pyridoxal phosphate-dependent enzyme n=1 Tax=Fluviicola sp. TaxID=1917219 RepID=UPI00281A4DEA|nr:YggS family pyridoxal phosphate-dependent enzyme [Fluviicola sp.]MDR0801960.1 YggS family pyridoxal phosphate-dependent enzyme [Fluviicola sp.]
MSLAERIRNLKEELGGTAVLVAVSKTKPASLVQEAYNAGQRVFGENKVQEMVEKWEVLPKDIQWHLIGHLQSNKVKYIASFVSLIHSVDSMKLLREINSQGEKAGRIIPCLLQFHIAQEDSKFGLSFQEAEDILQSREFVEMQYVSVNGLMGMASFTDDEEQVRNEFRNLHNYFAILKSNYFKYNPSFKILSMGMSSDYKLALEEGSTMIRVGSSLFGER